MPPHVFWWILAFLLIALELTLGTFYLLLYGVAAAAAGLAGWLGLEVEWQLLTAAVIAVSGTFALRHWRNPGSGGPGLQDLDIGQQVHAEIWQEGRGQVRYRGTVWDAEAENSSVDPARPLYIRAIRGTILILGN